MTRPDYCPVAQEPCQAMCAFSDVRCQIRDTAPQVAPQVAPPQRQPLTEEEIVDAVRDADLDWHKGWTLEYGTPNRYELLARAIERKHGIGGGE